MTDNIDMTLYVRHIMNDPDLGKLPDRPGPTGIENLDEVNALKARIAALEGVVMMLMQFQFLNVKDVEDGAAGMTAALFGTMMRSSPTSDGESSREVAEALATNLIESAARDVLWDRNRG